MVDKGSGQYTPEYLVNILDFSVSAVWILVFDKEVVSGQ